VKPSLDGRIPNIHLIEDVFVMFERWRPDVEPYDSPDPVVGTQSTHETAGEVSGRPGNSHDPAAGVTSCRHVLERIRVLMGA
jgi:hypothetical protein